MPTLLVKTYKILETHLSQELFAIYKHKNGVYLDESVLIAVDDEYIRLREKSGIIKQKIYFAEGYGKTLLNVYNSKYVDLLKAKPTDSMGRKLLNSELQKLIVKNLKFNMGEELFYVCLSYDGFEIHRGKFINMRMSDIIYKPNLDDKENISIPYISILHIYNSEGDDLIHV